MPINTQILLSPPCLTPLIICTSKPSCVLHSDRSSCSTTYSYTPSIPAAAIFAVIFFASGAIHGVQLYRTKGWYFLVMLIGTFSESDFRVLPCLLTVLVESIGYVGRIISHNDPQALGPFIMQELMILLAPALLVCGHLLTWLPHRAHTLHRPPASTSSSDASSSPSTPKDSRSFVSRG